jgi:hypothetical protein
MPLDLNTIANRAFRMAGLGSVDMAEESDQAELANSLTRPTIEACLSRQEWNFAIRTFRLDRDDTQEFCGGYRYAFNLPGDRLSGPIRLLTDPRERSSIVRNFACEGRFAYADEAVLYGRFMVMVDPDLWPPIFREAVVHLLASRFALAAAQQTTLAGELERLAIGTPREEGLGGLLGQAAKLDAASGSNREPAFLADTFNLVRD